MGSSVEAVATRVCQTLAWLSDIALTTFNVSGNAPLSINTPLTTSASTLTVNDSVAVGASAFAGIDDNALTTLTLNTYSLTLGSISTSATGFTLVGNVAGPLAIGGRVRIIRLSDSHASV